MGIFEKAVEEIKQIPDIEPKILESLHKAKKNETYIITPIFPKKKPKTPNLNTIPKRYPESNKWIWDLN